MRKLRRREQRLLSGLCFASLGFTRLPLYPLPLGMPDELLFLHQSPAQVSPSLPGFLCPCLCECTQTGTYGHNRGPKGWLSLAWDQSWVLAMPREAREAPAPPPWAGTLHLKVGEVLLHEAVDLAHRQAACLAVLQGHGNQTAGGKKWGRPCVKAY